MNDPLHSVSLTHFAATAAGIMGIDPPVHADAPLDCVCSAARELLFGTAQRTVIYNPDAVAKWLYARYRGMFETVFRHTQLSLPFRAVMPSVTPVCFATMYTGVSPEVHGVYSKTSAVTEDTLFDAAVRAGKRTAIVAVEDSSMARIFPSRQMDYHILRYDGEVAEKAQDLIRSDAYDLIAIYTQEYDDEMHRTRTESPEALRALQNQIDIFGRLAEAVKENGRRTALYFSTDHGVHDNPNGGGHGSDLPEDLNIVHYLGLYPGNIE